MTPRPPARRWALTLAFIALLAGCTDSPATFVEPAHHIVYEVSAGGPVGAMADELDVAYTDSSGSGAEQTIPGPAWRTEVTTEPGVSGVRLASAGRATFGTVEVMCTITVDGVRRSTGLSYSCHIELYFDQLRPALESAASLASQASQSPTATATTQAPPSTPPASIGPDPCRYVPEAKISSIARAAGRGKGLNNERHRESVGNRCRYVFTGQGTVTFWWAAREHSDSAALRNVSELNVPAFWIDFVESSSLEVQLPGGVFHVQTAFTLDERSNVDQRELAIEFFRAARPRLS